MASPYHRLALPPFRPAPRQQFALVFFVLAGHQDQELFGVGFVTRSAVFQRGREGGSYRGVPGGFQFGGIDRGHLHQALVE